MAAKDEAAGVDGVWPYDCTGGGGCWYPGAEGMVVLLKGALEAIPHNCSFNTENSDPGGYNKQSSKS